MHIYGTLCMLLLPTLWVPHTDIAASFPSVCLLLLLSLPLLLLLAMVGDHLSPSAVVTLSASNH